MFKTAILVTLFAGVLFTRIANAETETEKRELLATCGWEIAKTMVLIPSDKGKDDTASRQLTNDSLFDTCMAQKNFRYQYHVPGVTYCGNRLLGDSSPMCWSK